MAAGLALTAVLWSQNGDETTTAAKPRTASSTAPQSADPLTAADNDSPLGGDPKVPDKTGHAQSDASQALNSWSSSNPKGSGSHSVGGDAASGSGGDVTEVLRIPALGKSWAQPVYEGVGNQQLRAGVGHFPGTEQPGQVGNYAIAGHRSGVATPAFKDIDRIQTGATITVTTSHRITYVYKVTKVQTVAPTDVNVIAQVPGDPKATPTKPVLTLVTCWPANGSSKRVVLTADMVGSNGGTTAR